MNRREEAAEMKRGKRKERMERTDARNIFKLFKEGRGGKQQPAILPASETTQPKHKIFLRDPMVTLQVKPDKTARNWDADDLARALHEIYTLPLRRFGAFKVGWKVFLTYRPQEHATWDITMEEEAIRFWITIPARWAEYTTQKMQTIWPRAEIMPGTVPGMDPETSACAELSLQRHDIYSLGCAQNNNRPLNAIMEISKDLREGDRIRTQVFIQPRDRQDWSHTAIKALTDHRDGKKLHRHDFRVSIGGIAKKGLEGLDAIFKSAAEQLTEFMSDDKEKKPMELFEYMLKKEERNLSDDTLRKVTEPVFNAAIRLAATSKDRARAEFFVKGIANAYNDISQDNEFKRRDITKGKAKRRFIEEMNKHARPAVKLNYSIFSSREIGKLIQIPGPELQEAYPTIEQVPLREEMLAKTITSGGLLLGAARYHGHDVPVYMPTDNVERLCLPHIGIGGMGTGKTEGFAANWAYQSVKKGYTVVVIDPGKGQIGDEMEKVLHPDQITRIRFGKDIIAIDWREALHSDRARNAFANYLMGFVDAASDEAGAQTVRFLRAAAKSSPSGSLKEIMQLFNDKKYRKALIPSMRPTEQTIWQEFDKCGEGRQNQIAMPVLNRLDVITGDDYLMECLDATDGLDFVDILDKPGHVVILDVPQGVLGVEGVDVIGSWLSSKLQMALTLRQKEHPAFIIQDEPHQYLRGYKTWKNISVISRKYRVGYIWLFHAWEQIPRDLAAIIMAALPHYHIFTSSKATYRALAEELKPFTVEEGMQTPFHWAINVIRTDDVSATPFLAHMAPPPSKQLKTAAK